MKNHFLSVIVCALNPGTRLVKFEIEWRSQNHPTETRSQANLCVCYKSWLGIGKLDNPGTWLVNFEISDVTDKTQTDMKNKTSQSLCVTKKPGTRLGYFKIVWHHRKNPRQTRHATLCVCYKSKALIGWHWVTSHQQQKSTTTSQQPINVSVINLGIWLANVNINIARQQDLKSLKM